MTSKRRAATEEEEEEEEEEDAGRGERGGRAPGKQTKRPKFSLGTTAAAGGAWASGEENFGDGYAPMDHDDGNSQEEVEEEEEEEVEEEVEEEEEEEEEVEEEKPKPKPKSKRGKRGPGRPKGGGRKATPKFSAGKKRGRGRPRKTAADSEEENGNATEEEEEEEEEREALRRASWRATDVDLLKKSVMLFGLAPIHEIDIIVQGDGGNDEAGTSSAAAGTTARANRWEMIRQNFLDSSKNETAALRADAKYGVEDLRCVRCERLVYLRRRVATSASLNYHVPCPDDPRRRARAKTQI